MKTLKELIEALKSTTSPDVLIYWDRQDRNNEGPAYRVTTGEINQRESGALDLAGWAHVSGRKVEDSEVVGYNVGDYFGLSGGEYKGPDQDGIYPVLE